MWGVPTHPGLLLFSRTRQRTLGPGLVDSGSRSDTSAIRCLHAAKHYGCWGRRLFAMTAAGFSWCARADFWFVPAGLSVFEVSIHRDRVGWEGRRERTGSWNGLIRRPPISELHEARGPRVDAAIRFSCALCYFLCVTLRLFSCFRSFLLRLPWRGETVFFQLEATGTLIAWSGGLSALWA